MKPFAMLGKLLGRKPSEPQVVATTKAYPRRAGKHKHMNPAEPGFENRDQRYRMVDPIMPPFPLPHVSRASLRRIHNPLAVPHECPFCGGEVALDSNDVIYRGKRYGDWPYVYHCAGDCDAYVGLHPNTDIPLGYLADRDTRDARKQAKEVFFEWLTMTGMTKKRNEAYPVLANLMGLSVAECHFAMFDIDLCEQAIAHLSVLMGEHMSNPRNLPKDKPDGDPLPWEEYAPLP